MSALLIPSRCRIVVYLLHPDMRIIVWKRDSGRDSGNCREKHNVPTNTRDPRMGDGRGGRGSGE